MLCDLQEWLGWDHLFALSLGPFVKWLESEVHTNELICLVTMNGKVIRIDPTATVVGLLNASFQRSPIRAATQLLSLLALYPSKLRVIMDHLTSPKRGPIAEYCRSFMVPEAKKNWRVAHDKGSIRLEPNMAEYPGNAAHVKFKNLRKNMISAVSVFILEILGYLPTEFRSFAAVILLLGLENVVEDAPSALLCECNPEQRLMLYEVGLSLGISKWNKNFHEFPSISSTKVSVPSLVSRSVYSHDEAFNDHDQLNLGEASGRKFEHDLNQCSPELDEDQDTTPVRQEKCVMDSCHFQTEISMSEECHALLGRFIDFLSRLFPCGPYFLLVPVTQILLHWAKDFESGLLVSDDIKCLKEFLLELETKLLPLKGKWVPQHPYYVCVCSRADEELLNHLNHSDAMKIIHLSYLGNCEKGVLQQNIAVILEAIGIPPLSKVVNRVAVQPVLPRTIDCSRKASLVSRALNKAQVYFNKSKFEAKEYILQRLSHLEIFEVEKLAYNYAIRKLKVFSKRQFECSCLQQGNILYITPDSDSREISLELAQELVNGYPNRMASLFDLYITMEESNGQTEPMVSDGSSFHESAGTSQIANEKTGIKNDQSLPGNSHHRSINCIVEIFNKHDQNTDPYGQHKEALVYFELNVGSCEQNRANTGRHDEATKTGRDGERRAFKHLKKEYGAGNVEWKNAKEESKLPFDFIIWEDESQKVIKWYVEVKATNYARKNCFTISHAEFKWAYTHGEKYVIMHICLANGEKRFFEDPVKQLRQDKLRCSHMDILMPG